MFVHMKQIATSRSNLHTYKHSFQICYRSFDVCCLVIFAPTRASEPNIQNDSI